MRTTITIDEELLDGLKDRAAREGTTVIRLIEESVRVAVRPHADGDARLPFELVTFGKGGRFTSLDVDRGSVLIEQDDLAIHGGRA
jgi:hypothetical protein